MRALLPALALVLTTLSACSAEAGEAPEQPTNVVQREDAGAEQWRADLAAELGTDTFDFLALQQAAALDCQRTDATAWAVELALSGDVSTSALTRIGLEHSCADVVGVFDDGLAAVEQAGDPLDLVCGPDVPLSAEDRLRADLVCAQR